jgi:hypothetical protein
MRYVHTSRFGAYLKIANHLICAVEDWAVQQHIPGAPRLIAACRRSVLAPDVTSSSGKDEGRGLGGKDDVALFIALLQTVALPMLVLILMIVAAVAVLRILH